MTSGVKNIAVIAVDPDTRLILKAALQKQGYEIWEYGDATKIFERSIVLPDTFIVDNDLAMVDGLALCKFLRIQKESAAIPIILLSAYPIEKKALKAGANNFIQKPFDLYSLLEAIKTNFEPAAR
jgi:DNA-binding response OmpR family regulator